MKGRSDRVTKGRTPLSSDIEVELPPRREITQRSDGPPGPPVATYADPKAIRIWRKGEDSFVLPIYRDTRYTFGRDPDNTVVFAERTISRSHGMLVHRPDGCWAWRDLGSSNGSFLSEYVDFDGETEEAERVMPGRDRQVCAGQSIVLGNRGARISFLLELPESERNPKPVEDASPATQRLERSIQQAAAVRVPVLIVGPKGSGKTYAAKRIHEMSGLQGAFVPVNCAALPTDRSLLHSFFLGHVANAFTDAKERPGHLFQANGGTLFLDEVESMPMEAQNLLLDVLEGNGLFAPLGAPAGQRFEVPRFRVISASKKTLRGSGLREDLCDRLATGVVILMPTLAERKEDIPGLVQRFVKQVNEEHHLDVRFDPEAVKLLVAQPWPGHVRELEGVVKTLAELASVPSRGSVGSPPTQEFKRVGNKIVPARPPRAVVSRDAVREHLASREIAYGRTPEEPSSPPQAGVLPHPDERLKPKSLVPDESPSVVVEFPHSSRTSPPARKRPRDYTREDILGALERNGTLAQTARELGMVVNTLKTRMDELGIPRPAAQR